jgi:hypothetical protein
VARPQSGYILNDPVNAVDPFGLLNILGGVGGSAVAPLGIEGSGGIVINPGFGNDNADIGAFGLIGAGGGVNVSGDIFIGFIRGDISNVSGVTANINIVAGPVSLAVFINPKTGQFMGFTAGVGPSATIIGASGTLSITGTFTLRDLIKLIRELFGTNREMGLVPCH